MFTLTWRNRYRSGVGRPKSRQDLLADLFEDLAGVARAVFKVQDDVVHAGRPQGVEKAENDVAAPTKAQVDRFRGLIGVIRQIDVEGLDEGFEHARCRGGLPPRG
jgi:hypothetical protein